MASILLDNCSLSLPVYGTGNRSLKQMVMSAATGGRIAGGSRQITVVEALRDISLAIEAGDRIGLLGHNGAGKTTLLRLLGGVYEPSGGALRIEGRVTSLIDVTLGMDFEATGYENILLRGLMLGIPRPEIRRLTPDIAEFSGLGDYLAMPVRTYSSGMVLRLAFSIVTSVHADILLMDEWLSVGDAEFVKKAEDRLKALVDKASILVLASHNPKIINDLCNITVSLEHGRITRIERLS
ncbi:ABC transporter ATP-binding protein [Luteibacter sp. PPL201]|uniref:ABC transporter ATP-binding protein n=1 Tax=Luteibacter sahnii TaxID=3021977 RepID=A0ABT6B9R4_9GAMM|nr:ABC transporter ATP-binding protein [Luteibacter sp. PPL193]MDY1546815.1 ABC transporter ATP-binding protein [Luteibacter sp. PPL193]